MKKRILLTSTILGSLALVSGNECLAMSSPQAHEHRPLSEFVQEFRAAFYAGDIATMLRLKETQSDFRSITDLGEGFFHYGSGMKNFPQLISDATENYEGNREGVRLRKKFAAAFHKGDVKTLEHLKKTTPSFYNIDDLGKEFVHYGPGMRNWDKLISDARKNSNLDNLEGASQIFS